MTKTLVVHWDDRPADTSTWVYIGRKGGGPFGNPFMPQDWGGREGCIARFRSYFYTKMNESVEFTQQVRALKGKVLVCHCKPMACHGDIIAEYLDSLP